MTFQLEADGVRFWCSSPVVTRKLVERGARLVDEAQAEALRRALEPGAASGEAQAPGPARAGR
jgi:hypothetical protein